VSGPLRVLIAAGGTGGHVFPGLALARTLTGRDPSTVVTFAGTERGIEGTAVPAAGFEVDMLPIRPLKRRLSVDTVLSPGAAVAGVGAAARLIKRREVDVVAGMGGYVTLPVAMAAKLSGVPVVLHEQNAVPGIANKLAARVATTVALGVGEAAAAFGGATTVVVGNPVRPELAHLDRAKLRPEALEEFGLDPARRTLFVFGGSQGARRINNALIAATPMWPDAAAVQILHACGRRDEDDVRASWRDAKPEDRGLLVRITPFIDRMDLAYSAADLAVTRAGALTVAELTAAGVPAIMIPLPHATAGHQAANARVLAGAGGVVDLPDAELTDARLAREAWALLDDPGTLDGMAKVMRELARPQAADDLADAVLAAAGRAGRDRGAAG
jgi:UDP-N-acetylglucosamine--N-acetylmuramyl-(pentapeptide) pyrophosphoryl-undecaprenol N-acetylglucosamine transferase